MKRRLRAVVADLRPRVVAGDQSLPRPTRPLRRGGHRRRALAREPAHSCPPTTTLALNADDPAVAALGDGTPGQRSTMAWRQRQRTPTPTPCAQVVDTRTCPRCRTPLTIAPRFYSHIGHWACPDCGYAARRRRCAPRRSSPPGWTPRASCWRRRRAPAEVTVGAAGPLQRLQCAGRRDRWRSDGGAARRHRGGPRALHARLWARRRDRGRGRKVRISAGEESDRAERGAARACQRPRGAARNAC